MKLKRLSTLLALTPLLLTSCGIFKGQVAAVRNGDYEFTSISDANPYRSLDAEGLTSLVSVKEDYIVLFAQKGCSSCQEFAPKIEKYIEQTEQLIYRVEVDDVFINTVDQNTLSKFFPDGVATFPSVFVSDGEEYFKRLDNNRFSTKPMFTNYMRQLVHEVKTYSFTRFSALNAFPVNTKGDEFIIVVYDRNSERIKSGMWDIKKASLNYEANAIVDVALMSEQDRVSTYNMLGITAEQVAEEGIVKIIYKS